MSVKETVQAAKNASKSVKDIKDESEQANGLDLDLTSKFEEGRQIAIAEGKAVLSGYFQGRLEVASFIKTEILAQPIKLQSATYEVRSLPPSESQSNIHALFYGDDHDV